MISLSKLLKDAQKSLCTYGQTGHVIAQLRLLPCAFLHAQQHSTSAYSITSSQLYNHFAYFSYRRPPFLGVLVFRRLAESSRNTETA